MTDIAITVENLSKRYRIGLKEERHETLASALMDVFTAPVRNFRQLRRLTRFDDADGRRKTEDGRRSSPFPVPRPPSGEAEDIIWALRDVSFEVKRGEVVGIIGRNGAGKSTLLKILAGITEPTSGRAIIRGRVGSLLEVGTGMHPELTGRENIYLAGTILGMKKAEIDRKFEEIVEFAEIGKFIDTPIKRYSSGMKVRLGFAIAAHLEPEILLVDEVLAVGDAAFQKKCLGKMGDVAKEGRTVLFVSHNMGAITNLSSRCLYIRQGRVAKDGPVDYVIAVYLNDLIAGRGSYKGRIMLDNAARGMGDRSLAEFVSIALLDDNGHSVPGQVAEGEILVFEIRIKIKSTVKNLQVGLGITRHDVPRALIMSPSPLIEGPLLPGEYASRIRIDPNYLRKGYYLVGLKLFANGQRQDTIPAAIQFEIVQKLSSYDNPAYFAPWAQSILRLDYEWSPLIRVA